MARVLILGGGCRGRRLASEAIGAGHAVRIVTRSDAGREAIEAVGAEPFVGDPNRLGTLRAVLEGVTVACWLLATAQGPAQELHELHVSRLPAFLAQAVDSTMRGFVYEARAVDRREGDVGADLRAGGALAQEVAQRNAITASAIVADPRELQAWLMQTRAALSLHLEI